MVRRFSLAICAVFQSFCILDAATILSADEDRPGGVNLLFNPAFNIKNNIESLFVAREYLSNCYVCVCDSYYIENPFHLYEYQS